MNRDSLVKSVKSAVWIALPGSLISLLLCTLLLGSGVFEMLLPVWLAISFTVISFAISHVPFIARRSWATIAISTAVVVITVICLRIF